MKICLCITRMFPFFFYFIPTFLFSTAQLSHPTHPHHHHLGNASDQEALLRFLSGITHDPSQSLLTTWKPNVSFCNWTGVICGRRRQRVVSLNVSSMGLEGTISPHLGNLSFLRILSLSINSFHGHIPYQLGTLFRLKMLRLSRNQLKGSIPPTLAGCRNLRNLSLSYNTLTGNIPSELCVLPKLQFFNLAVNNLTGTIPVCLGNISSLQYIYLSNNNLHGSVPSELGMLSHVTLIDLENNTLMGNIPSELCVLPKLQFFNLAVNNLTGTIPVCLGNISSLHYIYLTNNNLHGSVPSELGMLSHVTTISLDQNHLTGNVPSELGMNQKLESLFMGENNLQGNIPMEIGYLKSLRYLSLGTNNLSGRIPDSLGGLQQLRFLNLAKNQLSGNIPANLGKLVNLLELDLSYNKLNGDIPREVGGLANLALYFNLSNNLLHGPIPLELSKLTMVQVIDISANQLSGYIPSVLGSSKELEYLNLSCNALEGPIPMSLGELLSLQDVDFSSNNLSGGIPMSLVNLKMLNQLNFSFNNLSGKVPEGGVFKKLGAKAFIGNPNLCGPWVSLPPCYTHKHKSVLHLKKVIVPILVVVVTILSCLLMGILWRWNCKRHIPIEAMASLNLGHQRISYGELIIATEEFSDANLLGVGSFGKVYKGVLNDGTIVAVKLLNLENEGAHKSFDKECKVLGRVRHQNLIRIITSYSNHQIKALIFPLMPNGSLGKWLYPDSEVESGLTLIQRLNIAIDIAHGMAYLHHHCFMQVIHCDLKPNNVLLGEDMAAYLTDFGIATICSANSEDLALTSTHALKGSTGYIPPEYGLGGRVTTKGDVYSYGVVLLEMLTRKKPTDNMFVEGMNLQKWVGSSFPNRVGEVVDRSILRRINTIAEEDKELNCLNHLVSMGLLCTKESPKERPTMINIVSTLQNIKETFLGAAGIPEFQSDITHFLDRTSIVHNNTDQGQSPSTF